MTESDSIPKATSDGSPPGNPPVPAAPAAFKDRRVGLILFGIVQLLMALGFLLMAGLQLLVFSGVMGAEVTGPTGLYAVAAAVYVVVAAGTAWLGIGSIKCRRWARAMTLVLAWMGLVVGLLSTAILVSVFRGLGTEMARAAEAAGTAEAQAGVTFALGCAFLGVAFFYIVLPAAFVLFYSSSHVKATCEHHDPTRRWTDRLPLPVLAGGVLLVSWVAVVVAPLMGTPMPFFGASLTGPAAWACAIVVGCLAALLVPGFFRLERWAWLGTLLLVTLNGASAYLTFRGDGLTEIYESMGTPPEQIEIMKSIGILTTVPWMMLAMVLVMLGFYLWLGRYFAADSQGAA